MDGKGLTARQWAKLKTWVKEHWDQPACREELRLCSKSPAEIAKQARSRFGGCKGVNPSESEVQTALDSLNLQPVAKQSML